MPKDTFFNLSEEKKETILRNSIKEFGKYGFEKGNIGKIANDSGVSKGSMYQYFEDKKELYLHCIKEAFNISMTYTSSKIRNIHETSIIDLFYEGIKDTWVFLKEERDIYVFLLNLYANNNHSINNDALTYILDESRNFMRNLIKVNIKKGYIRNDLSTESILVFLEGISTKVKEHMQESAEKNHKDFCDMKFDDYENFLREITILVKCALT